MSGLTSETSVSGQLIFNMAVRDYTLQLGRTETEFQRLRPPPTYFVDPKEISTISVFPVSLYLQPLYFGIDLLSFTVRIELYLSALC